MTEDAGAPLGVPPTGAPDRTAPFRPLTAEQAALLEHSPNPQLVLDRAFRIRFVNLAAAVYGHVDRQPLVGRLVAEVFPGFRDSIFERAYREVLETGAPARFERYDRAHDRWQSVYAYPADDGVIAVLEDVSDERRLIEELRRSEETLRLAQEAAGVGSFDVDLRTRTVSWSDEMIRLVGLDPATLDRTRIGRDPALRFVHPDDEESVGRTISLAISSGEKQVVRHRLVRADGDIRHVVSSGMLVRDVDGAPARLVGTAYDITDELAARAAQEALDARMHDARTLESLGVLAGGVAHDFNNLLVGIMGNASLALLDLEPWHPVRDSVGEIETAARRASDLTRQLLAYAGKGRVLLEPADASTLVRGMHTLLRTHGHGGDGPELQLADGLPRIVVDRNQFQQVVMNLVTNAVEAVAEMHADAATSPPAGAIRVQTEDVMLDAAACARCVPGGSPAAGRHVAVRVRDTGPGVDDATRLRMFEPFFSTKFTGRGLGLAATLGIVRSHGGGIVVDSAPGRGTEVTLYFPAAPESIATQPLRQVRVPRILVVDEDVTVRHVASALLRRHGMEVREAPDGAQARALLVAEPHAYDLVLLDVSLPAMHVSATLQALHEVRATLPIIAISGYSDRDVARALGATTPAGFLQKPFSADELLDAVRGALRPT